MRAPSSTLRRESEQTERDVRRSDEHGSAEVRRSHRHSRLVAVQPQHGHERLPRCENADAEAYQRPQSHEGRPRSTGWRRFERSSHSRGAWTFRYVGVSFCAACGGGLPATARFCPSCGEAVGDTLRASEGRSATPEGHRIASALPPLSDRAPRVRYSALDELAPFPPFASRVAAWLIDLAVVGVLIGFGAGLGSWLLNSANDESGNPLPNYTAHTVTGAIVIVVFIVCALLYMPLGDSSPEGQTIGKRLVGLRVVRARDGQQLTFVHALGRFLARIADVYSIGLLWAAIDPYGRTFHDHLASTVVIDVHRSLASGTVPRDGVEHPVPSPVSG